MKSFRVIAAVYFSELRWQKKEKRKERKGKEAS
jgi:hypothetical protein